MQQDWILYERKATQKIDQFGGGRRIKAERD